MAHRWKPIQCLVAGAMMSVAPLFSVQTAAAAEMSAEITVSAQDFDEYLPDVAYNSVRDEYFVVWHDNSPLQPRSVMGRRYTAEGVFIAEYVIAFNDSPARDNAQPAVAYDPVNDRYLVVWVYDYFGDGSDWDVHGRLVPWDGPTVGLNEFVVTDVGGNQWNPRVAWGGTVQEYMVTWWSEANGGWAASVYERRVSAAGVPDYTIVTVASDPTIEQVAPDIAYNQARNEYLIVYQKMEAGGGDVFGVRLSGSGAILGGGGFGIAAWPDAETAPRVAASRVADRWAVAWQSQVEPTYKDVYARLLWVDGTGTVQMASPVNIDHTVLNESVPDISAHSESLNFLIAYQAQYSSLSGEYGIHAQVLVSDNSLGQHFSPRVLTTGDVLTDCRAPAVAGGVNDWFVAWEHIRDATPSYQDIHGRVLFADIFTDGFESSDTSAWSSTAP